MKKGIVTLIIAGVLALSLFMWVKNGYNSMVRADENVQSAWAQVENVYQRRADLIPNLVATVKGYASHESSTLENVIAARANATRISIDPEKLTEKSIEEFNKAQGELSSAIGREHDCRGRQGALVIPMSLGC